MSEAIPNIDPVGHGCCLTPIVVEVPFVLVEHPVDYGDRFPEKVDVGDFERWNACVGCAKSLRKHHPCVSGMVRCGIDRGVRMSLLGVLSSVVQHERKLRAMVSVAGRVVRLEFDEVKQRVADEGGDFLSIFDFIGPVTSLHLAKNLGMDVVKPDRYLVQIAACTRYESAGEMCESISALTGEKLAVNDTAIWRLAATTPSYESFFYDDADAVCA